MAKRYNRESYDGRESYGTGEQYNGGRYSGRGDYRYNDGRYNDGRGDYRNDDRYAGSYGMDRRHNEGDYSGEYARRTQEMEDAGMIREDRSAVANLPQNVMYKPYPHDIPYINARPPLDDTIRGVDRQEREDVYEAQRHLKNNKW